MTVWYNFGTIVMSSAIDFLMDLISFGGGGFLGGGVRQSLRSRDCLNLDMLRVLYRLSIITIYLLPLVFVVVKAVQGIAVEYIVLDVWFEVALLLAVPVGYAITKGLRFVFDKAPNKITIKYESIIYAIVWLICGYCGTQALPTTGKHITILEGEFYWASGLLYLIVLGIATLQFLGLMVSVRYRLRPVGAVVCKQYHYEIFAVFVCNFAIVLLGLVVKAIVGSGLDNMSVDLYYVAIGAVFYLAYALLGLFWTGTRNIKQALVLASFVFPFATILLPIIIVWLPLAFVAVQLEYIIIGVLNIAAVLVVWYRYNKGSRNSVLVD